MHLFVRLFLTPELFLSLVWSAYVLTQELVDSSISEPEAENASDSNCGPALGVLVDPFSLRFAVEGQVVERFVVMPITVKRDLKQGHLEKNQNS